ncbi:MAG: hypothetical protein BWY97_00409 [Tenericutes bacterium ADurb.BinA124]|nr:MAG: hypothetical protein BWY97_00409 [Tenericutes bacterium ADurb.BinA124]
MVSGYFDFAEINAIRKKPIYMKDHIKYLDSILSTAGEEILANAGTISHEQAIEKARDEYKKYQVKTLTKVEKEYLKTIKTIDNKVKNNDNCL